MTDIESRLSAINDLITSGPGSSVVDVPETPDPEPASGEPSAPFLDLALAQAGDSYVWGAGRTAEKNPASFDCSGLVYWAAKQVGVNVGGTAYDQWKQSERMSVEDALRTPGALLFVGDGTGTGRGAITHVAISLGDGRTIEARGRNFGVVTVDAATNANRFDFGGSIQQLQGSPSQAQVKASPDDMMGRLSAIDGILKGQYTAPRPQATAQVDMTPAPEFATDEAKRSYQEYAKGKLGEFGWDADQFGALLTIGNRESGWNPRAQNPRSTAFGIGQFLNSTWRGTGIEKTSDPFRQVDAMLKYIKARYGDPTAALAFWDAHHYY